MSINLTLEKPVTKEEPAIQYTKRIDDLIEDAEIEAEIEAEQKIRAKNTKIVTISGLAVGLLVFLYFGIKSNSVPSAPTVATPEIAKANLKATPKPIPFPIDKKPESATTEPNKLDTPAKDVTQQANLKPLPTAPVKADSASKATPVAKPPAKAPAKTSATEKPAPNPAEKPKTSLAVGGTTMKALGLPATRSLNEPKAPAAPLSFGVAASQYFIQVGAFSSKSNAQRLSKRLKSSGFDSTLGTKTVSRNSVEKTIHTVKVGGFSNSQEAQNAQSKLGKSGFKNTFIFKSKNG